MSYTIGIDSSTTATKALLMSEAGEVIAVGRSEYAYESPRPLWAEQDPELWWEATHAAIREVLATAGVAGASVKAVGLTGQMHGLVLLDAMGTPVRPAILWNDQRTWRECDEIRSALGVDRLIAVTGNDALPGFTSPKVLWVRNNEPELYARAHHLLLPKDYVRYRLTGEFATDVAGGSGTALFDLAARTWSSEVVDALNIDPAILPTTHEGPAVTGTITADAAAATGLAAGTPVVAGGGDQAANAVGVGAVSPGTVAVSVGTSGVVFAPTSEPVYEPAGRLHAFCHALPDRWHLMGVMLSAAGSLQWYRDTLAPEVAFSDLTDEARGTSASADGVFFLPYLSGERTPHVDPHARGAFVGLTVRHDRSTMTRAVLEGVAFGLKDSMDLISASAPVDEVRVSGGGAVSDLWLQILADVLGTPLHRLGTTEGAAHGAAMLAALGSGTIATIDDAVGSVEIESVVEPGEHSGAYEEAHAMYRDLYAALAPTFRAAD